MPGERGNGECRGGDCKEALIMEPETPKEAETENVKKLRAMVELNEAINALRANIDFCDKCKNQLISLQLSLVKGSLRTVVNFGEIEEEVLSDEGGNSKRSAKKQ